MEFSCKKKHAFQENLINCHEGYQTFAFNTENNHFTNTVQFGWLEGANFPIYISYGTCEQF